MPGVDLGRSFHFRPLANQPPTKNCPLQHNTGTVQPFTRPSPALSVPISSATIHHHSPLVIAVALLPWAFLRRAGQVGRATLPHWIRALDAFL